jgi:hypothetical protein
LATLRGISWPSLKVVDVTVKGSAAAALVAKTAVRTLAARI